MLVPPPPQTPTISLPPKQQAMSCLFPFSTSRKSKSSTLSVFSDNKTPRSQTPRFSPPSEEAFPQANFASSDDSEREVALAKLKIEMEERKVDV